MTISTRRARTIRSGILTGRRDALWATRIYQIGSMRGLWAKAYRHSYEIKWPRPKDFWDDI